MISRSCIIHFLSLKRVWGVYSVRVYGLVFVLYLFNLWNENDRQFFFSLSFIEIALSAIYLHIEDDKRRSEENIWLSTQSEIEKKWRNNHHLHIFTSTIHGTLLNWDHHYHHHQHQHHSNHHHWSDYYHFLFIQCALQVSLQFIFFFPFHISLYFDSILLKILALVKRFNASKRPEVFA